MRHLLRIFCFFLVVSGAFAQEKNPTAEVAVDDLGNVSDAFKDSFFNALAQKAIGNHDRALEELQICLESQPNNAAVHFEIAKNLLAQQKYGQAESALNKAISIAGEKKVLLKALFETYDHLGNYEDGLVVMKKLVEKDKSYAGYLPGLYFRTGNYDQALALIEKLDRVDGPNEETDKIKKQILSMRNQSASPDDKLARLEEEINNNPKNELAYIQLITLYSQKNDIQGLQRVADQLKREIPENDAVHLALYKLYLNSDRFQEGLQSLERVLKSDNIATDIKFEVLKDFLATTEKREVLADQAEKAIQWFSPTGSGYQTLQAIAEYFYERGRKSESLAFYEKALEEKPNDFSLLVGASLLALDLENYRQALENSTTALTLFPTRPLPYLINGVANNELGNHQQAMETLLMGMDFLIDEQEMKRDFFKQLAIAYSAIGNTAKSAEYDTKYKQIKKQIEADEG